MGCLFEIFVEVFIEGVFNLFMFLYLKIAHVIVPNREIQEKTKNNIKNFITTASVLLALILVVGLVFLLPDDAMFNTIGKYMTFIPLSIIGLQVVLSIIALAVRIAKRRKK